MDTDMKMDESVLDRCLYQLGMTLVENENELVREAISRALHTKDWKIEDVADRGGVIHQGQTKTLTLDGRPILMIHNFNFNFDLPDAPKLAAKLNYKFLISEDGEYLV